MYELAILVCCAALMREAVTRQRLTVTVITGAVLEPVMHACQGWLQCMLVWLGCD